MASLSPQTSIGSRTTERLVHQMPDALDYRVGPHTGCSTTEAQSGGPLYVPEAPRNREGLQAREPSKCLNGQSYRERPAKEAF